MLLSPSTGIKKLSTNQLFDLVAARKDRRKGWTSWPEWRIKHDWGCNLRELHNSTELVNPAGELVGEMRWRQLECASDNPLRGRALFAVLTQPA